ncbi:aspartic peptidase domain-containing protein [Mycena haematopus]|nr:aspartic peptidase domain-containing protein [Mycena haematopus]
MQLPAPFLALLAAVTLTLSSVDARPVKRARGSASRMITLPLRRMQGDTSLPVELRHQQQMNRAERLIARAAGLPGPSGAQLMANLEKRASFLSSPTKRFSVSPDYVLPSENVISCLAVNDDSNDPPVLAQNSSQVVPDGADTQFLTTVQLGTPPRDFVVILDSGSSDFWVGTDDCTAQNGGGGCGNHTFLSAANSQSFVDTGNQWSVTYGSGAASGDLITDTLILGGMVLGNHTFGVANSLSSEFTRDGAVDGLMGLGGKGLSNQGVPTPVQALKNTGFIDAAITSYRLPRLLDDTNNGEITFGGLDDTKFDPTTLVTVNNTGDGFWQAPLDGVSVNGADVAGIVSTLGLMDTGTTVLSVPAKEAAAIHAQIPGAIRQSSGQYTVPCNTTASVALKFGGKSFPINPKDLPFASFGKTSGDCTSGIGSASGSTFLVGDTFLKSVYFSTNVDDNTITLAQAI